MICYDTPFGYGYLLMSGDLAGRVFLPGMVFPPTMAGKPGSTGRKIAGALSDVFAGKEQALSEDHFILNGLSSFALAVLREVRRIPAGETCTYGEVATTAGFPGAARSVGQVLSKNPFPLVFPCHRVVSANGPGGYQGGPEMKRFLLDTELKSCRFRRNVLL